MKILIVDDSKAMRMIVRRALTQAGYRSYTIEEATNGREALDAVRTGSPSFVLSDWNMPEMSGYELLSSLRSEGISVPFGFVTSEGTDDMRERAASAGARFLLVKPFTPEALSEVLSPILPPS